MTTAGAESLDALKRKATAVIDSLDDELRGISLEIHSHPELNFEEYFAHEQLTACLEGHGFAVERGAFDLPTAFRAVAGSGSPTIAVFCEYDALPGIGHACGHNLIAIAGVATGTALKQSLPDGAGTIVVLGSPAEEGGGGKQFMIDRGALDGVDAAMMLHPTPGDGAWANLIAIEQLRVEYFGRNAHAGAAPWDGVNALDAMVMAYNGISALRQQMRPSDRVHGVITRGGDKPNIIPDYTSSEWYVRAARSSQLEELLSRVRGCFEAAATATGCRFEITLTAPRYDEVVTNDVMAEAYVENMQALEITLPPKAASAGGMVGASTDMGNVSYVVPSIHPVFAIPVEPGVGNHTPGFTAAAATPEAHRAALRASKGLAMTGLDLFLREESLAAAREEFSRVSR